MNAGELLDEFEDAGIELWREGDQLRFRAPRGAMTEDRLRRLRQAKPELLATLPAGRRTGDGVGSVWRARPEESDQPFPLTDIQSAYLFGRNPAFDYGGVSCHIYQEYEYPADLDPDRFQRAWDGLVRRHDALRTVLTDDGTQRVLPELPDTRIEVVDLRDADADAVAAASAKVRAELSHKVHPTEVRPMYELRLHLERERSVLHVSVDFMALDWLSLQQVLSELDQRYRSPDCELPPVEATFRDYVLAHRRLRETERYERDRAYWLARVDELPGAPALPLREDHDPATMPARFRRLTTTVDPQTWRSLKARAAEHGSTPANAVLAAYAETIGRWSATERFSLALPVLDRMPLHPHVDRLLGDFTSLNVLAVDHDGKSSFAERARALGERVFEDLDHRLYSGVEVLRELARRRGREAATAPVVFTGSIGVGGATTSVAGRNPRPVHGISQTPQVWLDCQVGDQFGGLDINWDVREGVFPDGVVDDMFAAFVGLLHRLAEHDDPWKARVPQPLPERQRAVRAEVNATSAPVPEGLLHDPLVAYARANPDRTAVIASSGSLTFGQWLGRAAGLAEVLRSAGCRPGDFVGIVLDKGLDQVVAVLGVLLAGGVYVPVDPGQPAVRRDRILTDSGVRVAIVAEGVTAPSEIRSVCVAEAREVPVADVPDGPAVDPGELAYVIHTSGSTGVPKGVMTSHRAATNTVHDINRRFGVGDSDRVLGLAALSFDLSVYDLFGPPAVGAALVLPDPDRRGDPSHWAALVAEHGVTVWNSVPAQLHMLLHYLDVEPTELPSLRVALLSGDWIPLVLPEHAGRHLPGTELVSLGGATEAAIWSIHHRIDGVEPHWRSIPYGRPLDNQRFHVLDAALRECPDLVTGELYIAGIGLATGYLNDPERTAERFPFHPETGERLYRTGDLGRYLPNGEIEFLGRADQQVKIRGHRIELGEIESVLSDHPAVGTCVVLAAGEEAFERALVAFVLPKQRSADVDTDELLRWVADRLPAHMVPAWVRPVEAFPLTANGKVDRKRLLSTVTAAPAPRPTHTDPPRPGAETRIAELWADVLGRQPTSRDESFFDAGGNSLLAAQLVGRVREHVGEAAAVSFDVLLRALLDAPSVAGLAQRLEAAGAPTSSATEPAESHSPLVPLWVPSESDSTSARVLVHDATGTLVPYRELVPRLATDRPLFGLAVLGDGVAESVDAPASELVETLAAEHARTLRAAGYDEIEVVGYSLGAPVAFELARVLSEAGTTVRLSLVSGHHVAAPLSDEAADELFDRLDAERLGEHVARAREWFARIVDAVARYEPELYAGDLTYLCPVEARPPGEDPVAFWRDACLGEVTVVDVPGDHVDCLRLPHVEQLAAALAAGDRA